MQSYFEDVIETIKSYFEGVGTNILALGGSLLLLPVLALIIFAGMR
ncbi:hypothetical protein [Bacillus safensis]|nr:hypothetical protein [Bacillus safensis]